MKVSEFPNTFDRQKKTKHVKKKKKQHKKRCGRKEQSRRGLGGGSTKTAVAGEKYAKRLRFDP